jgi:hypothetical protein
MLVTNGVSVVECLYSDYSRGNSLVDVMCLGCRLYVPELCCNVCRVFLGLVLTYGSGLLPSPSCCRGRLFCIRRTFPPVEPASHDNLLGLNRICVLGATSVRFSVPSPCTLGCRRPIFFDTPVFSPGPCMPLAVVPLNYSRGNILLKFEFGVSAEINYNRKFLPSALYVIDPEGG